MLCGLTMLQILPSELEKEEVCVRVEAIAFCQVDADTRTGKFKDALPLPASLGMLQRCYRKRI